MHMPQFSLDVGTLIIFGLTVLMLLRDKMKTVDAHERTLTEFKETFEKLTEQIAALTSQMAVLGAEFHTYKEMKEKASF